MKSENKSLLIDALFEGGRMSVGAVSVAYLIESGMKLEQIALLKILQSFVLMFGEIPTGLYADAFGSRKSLIAGTISSIAGLLIFAGSSSFFLFAFAEILCAIALCFWSGAYEAYSIDQSNLESNKSKLHRFFHLNSSVDQVAVLAFGWIGGWVGSGGLRLSYLLGALLISFSFFLLLYDKEVQKHVSVTERSESFWNKLYLQFKETINTLRTHRVIIPFAVANVLVQLCIQPLLHYWQPAFKIVLPEIDSRTFGNIFAFYCGISALFSVIVSKLSKFEWVQSRLVNLLFFILFSLCYLLFAFSSRFNSALLFFVLLQSFLTLARSSLGIRMNEVIPSKHRASILSTVGFFSRLGMMGSLFFINGALKNGSDFELVQIFKIFALISVAVSLVLMINLVFTHQRKKKGLTVL